MAKQRIHISDLKIRLPRSAAGNARAVAESIGREILKSVAGASAGQTRNVKIGNVEIGGLKMSDKTAAQAGAKAAAEVGRKIKNGGRS